MWNLCRLQHLTPSSHVWKGCIRLVGTAKRGTSEGSSRKTAIMKLRHNTGYNFVSIRAAIDKFGMDNLEEAEAWLHELAKKEGWAKATKFKDRKTGQGLVGICQRDNKCVLLEINCETDFVAHSDQFRQFVQKATDAAYRLFSNSCKFVPEERYRKIFVDTRLLLEQSGGEDRSLGDVHAFTVGKLGENIILKRCIGLSLAIDSQDLSLSSYCHPMPKTLESNASDPVLLGRFGTGIIFRRTVDSNRLDGLNSNAKVGQQLCQHVIGMNPRTVGEPMSKEEVDDWKSRRDAYCRQIEQEDEDRRRSQQAADDALEGVRSGAAGDNVEDQMSEPPLVDWDEKEERLLRQEFLLYQSVPVSEFCRNQAVDVIDFVRLQSGSSA